MTVKVTDYQKALIKIKAQQCNTTVSTYLLACGLGYEPKARLSPREVELLTPLYGLRSDIVRFFAKLDSLNAYDRGRFLQSIPNIAQWLNLLADCCNKLSPYLDELKENAVKLPRTAPSNEPNCFYDSQG